MNLSNVFATSAFITCPIVVSTQTSTSALIDIVDSQGVVIGVTSDNKQIKACGVSYFDINADMYVCVWSNWSYAFLMLNDETYTHYNNVRFLSHIEGSTSLSLNATMGNNMSTTKINTDYGIRYLDFNYGSPTISGGTPYVMSYANADDACMALSAYLSPTPVNNSYFQLQNGYVAVFDIGNNTSYDIGLKGYSEELSTWLGDTFERTNQTYWFSDSLPSENDSMPATPNTKIVWEEDEPKNIFGQTHYMQAQLSGTSSGRYLYIYNPAVYLKVSGSGRNETQVKNSPLDVTLNPNITVYVYDTQGSLSLLNGGGLIGNITGAYGVATSDTSGGAITFTDPDTEQQYIQTSGGSTDTSSIDNKSVQGFLQELQNTLDYFVETIISLVSAPISHIKQLISTGSEFMNTLGGLFTWLPAPVMSVIVSALIVMVVIGVFKMFL